MIGNYFATIKPRKVIFEHKKDGAPYMSAYALVLAKAVFLGVDDTAKITFNANLLYSDYGELIRFNGFGPDGVAALCLLLCDFPRFKMPERVFEAFGIDKKDFKMLAEFYDFVKKDRAQRIRDRAAGSESVCVKKEKASEDN